MKHISTIEEGWHAPGYRDPELHLKAEDGEDIHVRLSPQAFVQLHDIVCGQQAIMDRSERGSQEPLDWEQYPQQTRHVAVTRKEVKR